MIISFAQFRPEKQHYMQLRIWKKVLDQNPDIKNPIFTLIGTCRGKYDEDIVSRLKKQAKDLGIEKYVDFAINQSHEKLFEYFQQAKVAIHTMKDEHFGIAVVELMASGITTIAHKSAGPKYDIIGPSP